LFLGSNYNASSPPAKAALILYNIQSATFTTVVDYRNTIPGKGTQTYTGFSTHGIDTKAAYVAFVAQGTGGYWGILKYTVASKVVQNIADDTTPIPGLNNRYFTGFQGPPSPNTDGRVTFRIVHEPDAITGVWLATPSGNSHTLSRLVGLTSNLTGIGVIERIGYGGEAFLDRTIGFTATVRLNGVSRAGVYRITLPAGNEKLDWNLEEARKDYEYISKSVPNYNEKESHLKAKEEIFP